MEKRTTSRIVVSVVLTIVAFLFDAGIPLGPAGGVLYLLIAILSHSLPQRSLIVVTSLQSICLLLGGAIPEHVTLEATLALRGASLILLVVVAHAAWRRINLHQRINRKQQRLRDLVNLVNDGILFLDRQGAIEHMNLSAQAMLGTDLAHAKRRPINSIIHMTTESGTAPLPIALPDPATHQESNCVGSLQNKQPHRNLVVECAVIALLDEQREHSGYAVTLRDLTYARIMAQQLAQHTASDPLTGLLHRGEYERRLQRVLANPVTDGPLHMIGCIKLQGLATLNESCGMDAADTLLQQISHLMQAKLRRRDTLSRLGADEFGILLEHCGQETALRISHDIVQAIHGHRLTWGHKIFSVSANIGLIPLTTTDQGLDQILAAAEQACYAAMQNGPSEVMCNTLTSITYTSQWPARIQTAIASERLQLSLQPIRALHDTEAPIAYEALLVMLDEQGNRIPAGAVMPLAHRLQRAADIDCWVLRRTCSWLTANGNKRLDFCSMNVSAASYDNPDYLDTLLEQLEQNNISPNKLCFEIAESDLLRHMDRAKQFIRAAKARGCRIAIDHFGTGFATLAHLHDIQIDYVKIDGGFVRRLAKPGSDLSTVGSLHQLAQLLGAKSIAHHAESDETISELRRLGIDYAQGYALGRPRPLKEWAIETAA